MAERELREWIRAAEAARPTCRNAREFDVLIRHQKQRLEERVKTEKVGWIENIGVHQISSAKKAPSKMANYFSAKRIAELNAGHGEVYRQFRELQKRFFLRTYKSERGAEYAKHGFCRRLETLVRAIDQVYEPLPPQQEEIPDRNNVVDGTIAIQAFTMNAFGCLENIAWVWLYEKNVKNDDGTDLDPMEVGLGKKKLRKALTQQFRDYLDKKKDWLDNLIEFRDSLAHRIPLFIPPYVIPKANAAKYNEFEKAKWEEPARSDPEEYEKVKAEQLKLCQFMPGMTHSIFEEASQVEFHSQLLNDYVTIDEYGRTLLDELDRDGSQQLNV